MLQTPLSQIMEITRTTAKEVSDATGINVTLLSKFKNNQRKMQYRSKYPLLLADFFLQCRAEQTGYTVSKFLAQVDASMEGIGPEQLRERLALWLTTDSADESVDDREALSVGIFRAANDLGTMLERFTERVLAAPADRVSVIHDFPDMQVHTSFLEFSLPYLEKMKRHGCAIRIMDNCPAPKTYMTIFNWLEFYFSGQIHLFSDYTHPHLHRMIFLLEDNCALVVLANDVGQKIFHSTLYTDKDSARYFQRIADIAAETSIRVIEKIPFSNIMDFLHTLDRFLIPNSTTYLVNPVMMYKTMNLDILNQVLEENGIPEGERKAAFETNRFTAYLRTKCPYKQIYDLSAMTRIAAMESTVDEELSEVYGRPIKVSRRLLHEHLQFLCKLNSQEKYDLLFVPFETLHLLHSTISYVVQKDGLFLAWDASRSNQRIYSRDPSIVQASYNYMEEIWNSIPAAYTSSEWQTQQIGKLLELSGE